MTLTRYTRNDKDRQVDRAFYLTKTWRQVRKLVLQRDNNTCKDCGVTSHHNMHVDHILPRKAYPTLSYAPSNLQTLCNSCHTRKASSMGRGPNYKERPHIGLDGFPEGTDW
jgi:5-methylcytosine-specific restriction endonuclease McrA